MSAADPLLLDRRALARLISDIERGAPRARLALRGLYPRGGRAQVIGVTGPPGCGKSTLVNAMARWLRAQPDPPTIAVVAVDPTSPFSGGAILGDRIRMRDLSGDPGVFIRSMASRGALGGVAAATADVVAALDAAGYDLVLIETVGAGQLEVDVASIAPTVILVEAPGAGDDVQAIKAGILEVADIVVVNKADRGGAEQTASALQAALDLAGPAARDGAWRVPVLKASAADGQGVGEAVAAARRHAAHLARSGEDARRRRRAAEQDIRLRLGHLLLSQALRAAGASRFDALVEAVARRALHPDDAAQRLLEQRPPGVE